jgi:DNA-binding transcriptional LysR family regulator
VELRHLRYFVAIADELNFTRAAQRLRVAQPALSRQIRQLEEEIGVLLLERNRRGVSLTDAGRTFLAKARTVLENSSDAVRAAQAAGQGGGGVLNIGYVWGLFHSLVPPLLAKFRLKHPNTSVNLFDLTATQQSKLLLDGQLDAGFIGFGQEANREQLSRVCVGNCDFIAVLPAAHRLARKRSIDLQSLANEMFIAVSEESYPGAAEIIRNACTEAGFQPKILQAAERGFTILGLVAANCGVALLPATLRALPHPGVVFRAVVNPARQDLFLVWNRRRKSSPLTAFVDELDPVLPTAAIG